MVRIERAGGLYHVLNRGNYRAAIFRDAATRGAERVRFCLLL